MCVHYNKSSEVKKLRQRYKKHLGQKIRTKKLEDDENYIFLLTIESEMLLLTDQYMGDMVSLIDGYYDEYDRLESEGRGSVLDAVLNTALLMSLLEKLYTSVGSYIHTSYSDQFNEKPKDDFMLMFQLFVSTRLASAVAGIHDGLISDIKSGKKIDRTARALRIIGTELGIAQSNAEYQTMRNISLSTPYKKYWIGNLDGRIRDSHFVAAQFYNRNNAIPFESLFQIGDSLMKYPRDTGGSAKEVVNCRCYISYIKA